MERDLPTRVVCVLCGVPLDAEAAAFVTAASRIHSGGSTFAAHPDCLIGAANNPNFAGLRVLVDESADPPSFTQKFTPRARRMLVGASTIAKELGHTFVGTEHFLLAMVREAEGIGGKIIDELAGREQVESRVQELIASDGYRASIDHSEEDERLEPDGG
jgi:hypothetical protein